MQRNENVKALIETGIFVAIALILDLVFGSIYSLPFGGSVSLAMLPIFMIAARRGFKYGVLGGAIFGILQTLIKVYFLSLPQYIMDYLVSFMVLGVAGIIPKASERKGRFALGIIIGSLLRLIVASITGILYWRVFIPDEIEFMNTLFGTNFNAFFASDNFVIVFGAFLYNALYLIPSAILCIIVGIILHRRGIIDLSGNKLH
ncbi:MAG: energy-coupled thiamine transporter ThiT [Candidatus Izemoplasmatales bacterium]|nr:energy-coupled thiamine transporter ThiT [Candidatus Izemoplasmatales bacterium]